MNTSIYLFLSVAIVAVGCIISGEDKSYRTFRKKRRVESAAIMERADRFMRCAKPYLRNNFSASELAAEIGTNRTYLSQAFKIRKTNFYDYVNDYRLNHFLIIARKPESRTLSVLELAENSGFSTLKVLNRYLKEFIGITASEYARSVNL